MFMKRALLVTGSRNLRPRQMDALEEWLLAEVAAHRITHLLHGGARGADLVAGFVAHLAGLEELEFEPDYDRYGPGAPFRRNEAMVRQARPLGARVIAWQPNGPTSGTQDTVRRAIAYGLPVDEYRRGAWIRHRPTQLALL